MPCGHGYGRGHDCAHGHVRDRDRGRGHENVGDRVSGHDWYRAAEIASRYNFWLILPHFQQSQWPYWATLMQCGEKERSSCLLRFCLCGV